MSESVRYSRYEARVQAVGRILDGIKRHRIAVGLMAATMIALLLCFLGMIGHFMGVPSCRDYIYGDAPACSVEAFLFDDMQYQFAPAEGEAIWSDSSPTVPGTYRIRAVSKNGFGQSKYSGATTFTLLTRELNIHINSSDFVYGEFSLDTVKANTKVEGLAPGDRIADLAYTVTEDEMGNYTASVANLHIVNEGGEEVTACYGVVAGDGYFSMKPRPITVRAQDAQKVYDAKVWQDAVAELTKGTLVGEDKLQVTFEDLAPTEAGSYRLIPVCTVLNAAGEDVSANYAITIKRGTLTIEKRAIRVRTESAEKLYDGKPLTNWAWRVTEGTFPEGQTLMGRVTGSRVAAGTSDNTITLSVTDATGKDTSANYDFSVETGTLTVTPITLKFSTDSAEKVYDGRNLMAAGCRLLEGQVLKNHKLIYRTESVQLHVGSSPNELVVFIQDESGNNVKAEGYVIEVERGTLTVTPRPITLTSDSAEKLYDGMPLTCQKFRLTSGSFAKGYNTENVRWTYFTGSQTEVGSSENFFTVDIASAAGNMTTSNYDITYVFGTLTVHENPNPPVGSGTGNGTGGNGGSGETGIGNHGGNTEIGFPNPNNETVVANVTGISGLRGATKIYFRDMSYGDYTGSGWAAAKLYPADFQTPLKFVGRSLLEAGKTPATIRIDRMNQCPEIFPYFSPDSNDLNPIANDCFFEDGAASYQLMVFTTIAYEALKDRRVAYYDVSHEEKYREFVYEEYLQIPSATKEALLEWATQKGISPDSKTLVEDIQACITNAAAYNLNAKPYPKNVDVAVYFLTEAKEGICQHFATAGTLMYRAFGIPARYTVGFVDSVKNGTTTELTTKDAHAWVEIYVDGLGWVPIEVTGSASFDELKTELHIKAYSATKYYDGKTFEALDLEQYVILSGSLREGHRLAVSILPGKYAYAPGQYVNQIVKCTVYDKNGKDVTSKYDIHLYGGTLEILPRKITITMGSASKVDDGAPLTCQSYWISEGNLVPGDELIVETNSAMAGPGVAENTASKVEIWSVTDSGSRINVTDRYAITIIPGELEVTEG